jgi:hypothetical protein
MRIFRLIIKHQWLIEEIYIFSNSSHLEWRTDLSDTILKGIHPRTIPGRIGVIWFSGFRRKDLNVIFYQNMPNLRWLLLLKILISSIVHCCFSISQNELKFELQLHGNE